MATKKNELVTTEAQLPAAYADFGGQGWDGVGKDDVAIPFINLIQDGSPQQKKASDDRIEGAEAGMFFDSVSLKLYPEGVVFVPVLTEQKYVEWVPRDEGGGGGAGFVGAHAVESEVVQDALKASGGDRKGLITKAGNDLVQTFFIYALALESADASEGEPVMLAISKSKLREYRGWMGRLNKVKGSRDVPLFANRVMLTSKPDVGAKGDEFFNVSFSPVVQGKTPEESVILSRIPAQVDGALNPLLVQASEFYKVLRAGEVKVDYAKQAAEGSGEKSDEVF